MKKKMNNRGEKLLSVYWFLILFIVAAGITYMVLDFYGGPYDVRISETDILMSKTANCFAQGGYLLEGYDSFDLLKDCSLRLDSPDLLIWKGIDQYYLSVQIIEFGAETVLYDSSVGDSRWLDACLRGVKDGPFCRTQSFYSLTQENKQVEVTITSAVRKTEKNVK